MNDNVVSITPVYSSSGLEDVDILCSQVLVTGATGLVGSHVVDTLLRRGIKVRAVARSKQKADIFLAARSQYTSQLSFYFIDDLNTPGIFQDAVKDVDGVIHVASVSCIPHSPWI